MLTAKQRFESISLHSAKSQQYRTKKSGRADVDGGAEPHQQLPPNFCSHLHAALQLNVVPTQIITLVCASMIS